MTTSRKQSLSRLLEAAADKGVRGAAAVARALNVSDQTVNNWKVRGVPHAMTVEAQRIWGVSAQWLTLGEGEKWLPHHLVVKNSSESTLKLSEIIALHPEDDVPEGMVQVPEYKIHFSAGTGSVAIDYELQEEAQPATYRLSWLQEQRLSLKYLRRFKVTGDSMEPLLFDGDTILVNTAENGMQGLREGKVYAIRYDNELRVKRLYRRLDGTLILRSDNPDYEDESVPPELVQEHITIIGRVREKSGSGGL